MKRRGITQRMMSDTGHTCSCAPAEGPASKLVRAPAAGPVPSMLLSNAAAAPGPAKLLPEPMEERIELPRLGALACKAPHLLTMNIAGNLNAFLLNVCNG